MVNPLGLGYDDEDSEEEEEEDDVETQHAGAAVNGLVPNGGAHSPLLDPSSHQWHIRDQQRPRKCLLQELCTIHATRA